MDAEFAFGRRFSCFQGEILLLLLLPFLASEGIQGGGIENARKRVAYPFWNVGFRRGFRCGYTVMSRVERNRLIFYIGIMYRQSGYIRLERTIGNADTIEFAIANEASLTVTSMTRSIFLGSLR